MKIITAKTAGFCMGVKRAVDMALDNTARYPHGLYTLGPLIHNKQTIDMLRERGARELDESQPLPQSAPVLIRAHGVAPEKQRRFESQGHEIIDGTCPKVKTVHKVITRYRDLGYSIVVTGDEGHAEVIGLMGYAGDRGTLIDSVEAVASLPRSDRVCLVSQTTFDKELFDRIAAAVRARFGDECVVVKKTICAATEQRQNETRALAKQVDALIVVGGINSANTRRLAQIAQECGTATQHVETEKQIDWNRLRDCRTVGITAGASTPHWMIKRVVDYVEYLDRNERRTVKSYLWRAFDTLAHLNIFVSLGAVAMYYASCHLQNLEFRWRGAVIAFLYFLSMYLLNSLASIDMIQHHGIGRYQFYKEHRMRLLALSAVSILAMLAISWRVNRPVLYVVLFLTLAGSVYHATIVPPFLRKWIRYRSIRDVPTSRDLFVALAWGALLCLVAQADNLTWKFTPGSVLCFLWIFFLAYVRSLIFDLRDIEGDRILGRETLVTVIGDKNARRLILVLIQSLFVLSVVYFLIPFTSEHKFSSRSMTFIYQLPVLLYVFLFIRFTRNFTIRHASVFSLLADGQFYICGFLAWLVVR